MPRNSATSPSPGFRSTITVDLLLSRASSTPQFTDTVVVPAPPLAPKNTSVVADGPRALRRFAARRRAAHRAVERFLVGRPGEELVGAGAHRLQDQIGIGGRRDGEDAGAGRAGAQPLDARHRRRGVAARVDDDEVRRRRVARRRARRCTLTGIAPARSRRPKCFLKASSSETMRPTSCAMATSASARARPGTALRPLWPWPRPRRAPSDDCARLRPGASHVRRPPSPPPHRSWPGASPARPRPSRPRRHAWPARARPWPSASCSAFSFLRLRLVQLLLLLRAQRLGRGVRLLRAVEHVLFVWR